MPPLSDLWPSVWHPAIVHFPIALLVLAGPVALAWAVRGSAFWRGVALLLLALGTAGAVVARETGEDLEHDVEGDPRVDRYLDAHEDASDWTLYLAAGALVAVGAAEGLARWRGRQAQGTGIRSGARGVDVALRIAGAVLALAAAGATVRTAHLGGRMTWGEGTGAAAAAPTGAEGAGEASDGADDARR